MLLHPDKWPYPFPNNETPPCVQILFRYLTLSDCLISDSIFLIVLQYQHIIPNTFLMESITCINNPLKGNKVDVEIPKQSDHKP